MNVVYPDAAALLLRVGFGLYMLMAHGLGKFQTLLAGGEIKFASVLGMPSSVCLALTVFAEFIACLFIIVGYKTRLATIPLVITMLVAAFLIHGGDPFTARGGPSKEMALLYLIGFLGIYLLGSGKYSLDDKFDSVL